MKALVLAVAVLVSFYTVLFGWENYREHNLSGAIGLILLALTDVALPVYMLYLRN